MEAINYRKMCSIEPLMGGFTGCDFSQFELVVIGRMMFYKMEFEPAWVSSIKHNNIHYKKNVRSYNRIAV
jgi:protein gp37